MKFTECIMGCNFRLLIYLILLLVFCPIRADAYYVCNQEAPIIQDVPCEDGNEIGRYNFGIGEQKPKFEGEPLSVNFQSINIRDLYQIIADFADRNIVVHNSIDGVVVAEYKKMPWDEIMYDIAIRHRISYYQIGEVIYAFGVPAESDFYPNIYDSFFDNNFSGEPIDFSINKRASIGRVFEEFAQLAGLRIEVNFIIKANSAAVPIQYRNMPWDQALYSLVFQNNLSFRVNKETVEIYHKNAYMGVLPVR